MILSQKVLKNKSQLDKNIWHFDATMAELVDAQH